MSAECFCAYDQPAFYSARTVTAGKQHKCSECFRAIQPGERYEYAVGKWDGHFDSGMCPLLAEIAALRDQLARFTPLRARGVVDADDNLDCWDTEPFEICHDHVAALNEKDPAAMWRVVELFGRDLGPNA